MRDRYRALMTHHAALGFVLGVLFYAIVDLLR